MSCLLDDLDAGFEGLYMIFEGNKRQNMTRIRVEIMSVANILLLPVDMSAVLFSAASK